MRIPFLLLALATAPLEAQRSPVGLYFQAGGEGLGLSANLDVGLTQSLRLRGGAGWIWTVATFPVTASYLVSKKNSTIEVGAGFTVMHFIDEMTDDEGSVNDFFENLFFFEGREDEVIPLGIVGWRYHPRNGAILRLAVNPMLVNDRVHLYGGLSLGFTF